MGRRRGGRRKWTDFKTLEKEAQEIKERKERGSDGEDDGTRSDTDTSESYSDSNSSDDEGKSGKTKGVSHLIEVNNPNDKKKGSVKARDANMGAAPTLTRREREELEKQRAKERYFKLQKEGKTEQARKDLERLAIIRKQREEAAKKR